ncbi:MAG: autotransporter domain-containing protein [Verrucomicrobia bacterium]|nr:autotransporter domain-containing protein [Verrucomicrobiota bacterium]
MKRKKFLTTLWLFLNSIPAFGAEWDGSTDANWSEPTNWDTNSVPTTTAVFPTTGANKAILFSTSVPIETMTFTSTAPYSFSSTVSETLTLTGAALIDVQALPSGNHAINAPLILGADTSFTMVSGSTFEIHGEISGSSKLTFAPTNASILALYASNSNTGEFVIGGSGTVEAHVSDAINPDPPNPVRITDTGSLTLVGVTQTVRNNFITNPGTFINLDGGATLTVQPLTGTSMTVSSTITGTNATLNLNPKVNYTLVLAATNSYSGTTNINGANTTSIVQLNSSGAFGTSSIFLNSGTLNLNNLPCTFDDFTGASGSIINLGTGELILNAPSGDFTIASNIIGDSSSVLNKTGGHNLNISGSNSYGDTIIDGGSLTTTAANTLPAAGAVTLTSGSLLLNNNNQTTHSLDGSSGTTISLGNATLTLSAGVSTINSTITGGGILKITNNPMVTLGGVNNYSGGTIVESGFLEGSVGDGSLQGAFTLGSVGLLRFNEPSNVSFAGQISGQGGIQKIGTGELTLTGINNSFTGGVSVTDGTLIASSTNGLPNNNSFYIDTTGTLHLENMSLTGSRLGGNTNGTLNLDNSHLTITGDNGDPYFGNIIGNGSLTYSGPSQTLLILTGTNTYTGGTTITSGGILTLSSPALPPTGLSLTGTGSLLLGADLTLSDPQGALGTNISFIAQSTPTLINLTLNGSGTATIASNITEDTSFGGTPTGSITKNGTGSVIFTGVNQYSGGLTINTGTVIGNTQNIPSIVHNSGTLIFNEAGSFTYSGAISNSGTTRLQGNGSLAFTGSLNQTALFVDSGTLYVNTPITAATTTVAPSATLGGIGPINGDVVVSGKVAPGNSIDTITIVGNYTQNSGSTLEMEINPIEADLVNVSGMVTIEPNATISLLFSPGSYASSKTYTLISSGAPISGTFTNVLNSSIFLKPLLTYAGSDLLLGFSTSPFTTLITQGNAGAIASCLETANPPPGSPLSNVINAIQASSSLSQAIASINELNPTSLKGLSLAQEETSFLTQRLIQKRMNELFKRSTKAVEPSADLWIDGTYEFTKQQSNGDLVGYDTNGGILALGLDFLTGRNFFVGASFVYTSTSVHFLQARGHGHVNSYGGNLYGSFYNSVFYLDISILGSYIDYTANRHITISPYYYSAYSRHSGAEVDTSLDIGLYYRQGNVLLTPYLSLDYLYLHEDSFYEKRVGNIGVSVRQLTTMSLEPFSV